MTDLNLSLGGFKILKRWKEKLVNRCRELLPKNSYALVSSVLLSHLERRIVICYCNDFVPSMVKATMTRLQTFHFVIHKTPIMTVNDK